MIRPLLRLADLGLLPDPVIRAGIRRLLRRRLTELSQAIPNPEAAKEKLLKGLWRGPMAVATEAANEQHYELPSEFFRLVLGPHLKYSCALYPSGVESLAEAEETMLSETGRRARLEDGQEVLELGCGWGSLTLWMAARYPASRITAVSNSLPQKLFIERNCRERGLANVEVITCDINLLATDRTFDRVVSVEMFEHVRNHRELLRRISRWLRPQGLLFVHLFCHRTHAYLFEPAGEDDWMARHFFTGGMMPSEDLLPSLQEDLALEEQWRVSGIHYQRTCEDWLENLDRRREEVQRALLPVCGAETRLWVQRWRIFFMACAELFGYRGGEEWLVAHYLFRHR